MYTMNNDGDDDGDGDDRGNIDGNPELLMQAMERMSILFDCVRRLGPEEAALLCQILPKVLFDFFPAADVVNRVISEFISPGQPHQVLLRFTK
jgi:huntingtin